MVIVIEANGTDDAAGVTAESIDIPLSRIKRDKLAMKGTNDR